jgi:signal transduction histidine kinase/CheY-like chemotaxis protein
MSADIAETTYKESAARRSATPRSAGFSASGEPDDPVNSRPLRPASTVPAVQWATAAQRRFALVMSAVMTASTLLLMPLAKLPWPNIPAFLQVYQTAIIGICLLTSLLMYGHYKATRLKVLLYLSAGYLYTGGILVMQLFSFAGTFTASGRIFGGSQTASWLWFLWHACPAVSIFFYALSEHRHPGKVIKNHKRELLRTLVALGIALSSTAVAVTVFHDKLPILDVNGDYSRITSTGIAPGIELMLAAALVLLWRVGRFRNLLHAWLGIVLVALLCDNAITMMAGSRLTLGWYVGRLGAMIAFSVFMLAYLREMAASYRQNLSNVNRLTFSNSQLDLDIEQRKHHVEKLMEADHRKDEFLVMLAHELRNPLAPISTAARLLSVGQLDEKVIKKTSQMLSRQVKQMTSLVDDLLDVSRVTRGLAVLNSVALDARLVLSDAVEQAAPLMEARRHHLKVELHPEPVFVLADHERMVQVMTNLLNNAAKYTKPGGRISLCMDVRDMEVCFSVTDNGIGMSPELVSRAFKLFSQGELTSDRSHGGLGIGLALVKSLVELHGGHVYAKSKGEAMGSEFGVVLPKIVSPKGITAPADSRTSRRQVRTQRMMIVDDNIDAANTLALVLRADGHEVAVEHVARRALVRARMDPPDVCLLDIRMPDMDGNELAHRLRHQPETAKCILIALSGYTQGPAMEEAKQAGFHHYLVKPVELSKLEMLLGSGEI